MERKVELKKQVTGRTSKGTCCMHTHRCMIISQKGGVNHNCTSDDGSYFTEDNDGWGEISKNIKGKTSQPIANNKKKKKYKKKERGVQRSLIGANMETVDKSPLIC